jgi:type IV pilus assembly protein PilE
MNISLNTQQMRSRASGFSLIELLIVIVIVGIIAMIAYPSYQDSTQKTRRADAKVALAEAATRQERIYTQSGSYEVNANVAKLLVNPDGVSSPEGFYTISVDNTASVSGCSSGGAAPFHCFVLTATAKGAQAGDTDCATLSLNHLGQKTSTGGGDCW